LREGERELESVYSRRSWRNGYSRLQKRGAVINTERNPSRIPSAAAYVSSHLPLNRLLQVTPVKRRFSILYNGHLA
jgi:hypothetical protein